MTRWKAAAIHLSISIVIGLLSAALIFGLWYPSPYGHAAGGTELVLLLLGVDVVLGPLLTLVAFKSGKRTLKFDLGVIALLQACAFLYGTFVVIQARPAFIVAAIDRFVLVTANDIDSTDLAQGNKPEFRSLPWAGPRLVGIAMPKESNARNDLLLSAVAGKDVDKFPKYYVDYAAVASSMLLRAKTMDSLRAKHPRVIPILDAWLRGAHKEAVDVVWLPLSSRHQPMTMLLDRSSGKVLGALAIDSW